MTLVVNSNRPLSEMRSLVSELFSQVPNKNFGKLSYAREEPPFKPEQTRLLRRVQTINKTRRLSLKFVLSPYRDQYDANPVDILEFLLGHEGKGSLFSLLLRRGLALGLEAGKSNVGDYFTIFNVQVNLTEKGFAKHKKVVELFFAYVRMLLQRGLTKALFEKLRQTGNFKFRFQSKADGLEKTVTAVQILRDYPPELVNRIGFVYDSFDPEDFQQLLVQLIPDNLLLVLESHEFDSLPQKEPIYGTLFSEEPLAPSFEGRIRDILSGGCLTNPNPQANTGPNTRLRWRYPRKTRTFPKTSPLPTSKPIA